ncbi:type I-F CRISPR-associated endoribonuclease Cas6/Csy4 [Colwellia sp. C1TZA3]|uniref:type I-F CRISPR-associated endoribonuclease Cas6/Csy4 n=1 Tax=Colwellia sp. C1TZA3 TaxID=2508879 RepID=UPI0011BA31DA|nr:type I-F CRISPR-associated endoribonuclease Cas6/Csy4 [Colwellia sp. C1TZA3]TWX73147.1 type I-F CRISPR-associated endoribonuclease Cas6/Csy4 [Colwellia sp. C1TZA3]
MDHYIDVKLKPDAEMRENLLLNKVYTKLHKALFTLKSDAIGVSFPQYKVTLGRTLRIHSNSTMLNDLQGMSWLGRLSGYCDSSDVSLVPKDSKNRIVSRKQSNMTQAKLNRLIKRGSITENEIKAYKAKMFTCGLDEPFLELESESNGNKHRRYINFSNLIDKPQQGKFDYFGLSKTATVPWF